MRIIPLIIASAALFYSCDKNAPATQQTNSATAPQNDAMSVVDTLTANTTLDDATLNSEVDGTTVASDAKPALNPEHGQPYHRCDIQVGAPIDSAPQSAAPQVLSPQTTVAPGFNTSPITPGVSTSAAPSQVSGAKPAFNPAHGEPHHRCDLQVGAPLT
ncbi:hypothetical protein [Kaistella polysaccharea]|uniref:hypothetical protein n=1 Tax=Kaistella polysaccharea TaxID=2878534 RepID=UPI001CF0F9E2|nr:hypothetical protein [Kaistella polysaccharea]